MKITIGKSTEKSVEFTLSEATVCLANAIRRIAMSQIPVFAIDTVTFYENDSALFDEYIANRVGLIPLETPEGYNEKDVVLFSLDKSGPGIVYSKHLKSSDAKVKVANKDVPIMKLGEGQNLRFEAKARLGKGTEHARYQAGIVTYEIENKDKGVFNFYVESFGQMKPAELVGKATEILEEQIDALEKCLDQDRKEGEKKKK